LTQFQAFRQPTTTPTRSRVNVQENRPGQLVSIQMPMRTPNSIGIATDQPMMPNKPRPNQIEGGLRRAFNLRASLSPTRSPRLRESLLWSACSPAMLLFFHINKAADKISLQLDYSRTRHPF